MSKLKSAALKKYGNLKILVSSLFRCDLEDLKSITINSRTTVEEMVSGIKAFGIWGYSEKGTIHYWSSPYVPTRRVVHFLTHELGHINYKILKRTKDEETMVEMMAEIGQMAMELSGKINKRYR